MCDFADVDFLMRVAKDYESRGDVDRAAEVYRQIFIMDPSRDFAVRGLRNLGHMRYVFVSPAHSAGVTSLSWHPRGPFPCQ